VSLFLTLAITVDLQEVVSPSLVCTDLFFWCILYGEHNVKHIELYFCVCGITFDFIQDVLFLLFYLVGFNGRVWWDKGHDSLWFKYWFVNWLSCGGGQDGWHTSGLSRTALV
jgi:hypothetical protein